jgi:glycosyltransferase involved in cell wall biosynthesis
MAIDVQSAMPAERSKISVITPSLNHGKFLGETIESILHQSYKNVEHVIVDGCSTDNTVDVLKEYPHIKWISEKEEGDNGCLDAIWKAFYMSTGEYIVFSCVSDAVKDRDWFKRATEILDRDDQVSHVWGLPQYISEDGQPGKVVDVEFLEHPPPQKKDFLPLWLATGYGVECNAVYRRAIFEAMYTKNTVDEPYRILPSLGFNYHLNTQGYLPYFLPVITNFGRVHKDQRQEKHYDIFEPVSKRYNRDVKLYRQNLLSGKIRHFFRDGNSRVIDEVTRGDLDIYRKTIRRNLVKNSLKRKFQRILNRI